MYIIHSFTYTHCMYIATCPHLDKALSTYICTERTFELYFPTGNNFLILNVKQCNKYIRTYMF